MMEYRLAQKSCPRVKNKDIFYGEAGDLKIITDDETRFCITYNKYFITFI